MKDYELASGEHDRCCIWEYAPSDEGLVSRGIIFVGSAALCQELAQLNLPTPTPIYHNVVAQPTEIQREMVQQLSERAAEVHTGKIDPSVDNMLKITSDGRKLGLDQRVINPSLPDDPTSKVNMCVDNVFRIWEDGKEQKLTQLLFCDSAAIRCCK